MTAHVMLDLETYGTMPGCPVLAVGAVIFADVPPWSTTTGQKYTFYGVAKSDQDEWGLRPEEDTVYWWAQQSEEARKILSAPSAVPLPELLKMFSAWFPLDACLWGNGGGFDAPILARAYHAVGLSAPWKFYHERCYRTMKSLAPDVKLERIGTHHNALDDASSQAKHLLVIAETLGLKLG